MLALSGCCAGNKNPGAAEEILVLLKFGLCEYPVAFQIKLHENPLPRQSFSWRSMGSQALACLHGLSKNVGRTLC